MDLRASGHPEFDAWRWNEYWIPLDSVIEFKREVYRLALEELARFLSGAGDSVWTGPDRAALPEMVDPMMPNPLLRPRGGRPMARPPDSVLAGDDEQGKPE